jgi:hypothetical protein
MITDSKKKQFDYVIVWKLDRFARNRYDSAIYKYKLKQNDVRVLSAMENIGDGDESIILEAVLEASAEYYSRDLSKKVKRGIRETAMKGGFIGGVAPVGYKVVDGTVVIDEEKAPAIKYAFEQYADGIPKKEIMRALTEKGVKNGKGKPLSLTSFQSALRNPKYTGEYKVNEIVMNNFPPLISKELFKRVQDRLKENSHSPGVNKAKVDYLLQGKIFCGHCGAKMVGESGRGKGGTIYNYYACSNRKKLHTCNKANEKKDFIEWYVVEQTVDYVLNPDRIEVIAKAVVAEYDKEFNDKELKRLERLIAKLDRDIDTAVDLMIANTNKTVRERTEKRIEELETQKVDAEIEFSKMQIANGIRYTKEDIILWLRQFCKGDIMDDEYRQQIIDVFVNKVFLYDDKIAIFYNIKSGKEVSFIDVSHELDNVEPEEERVEGSVRISTVTPHQKQRDTVFCTASLKTDIDKKETPIVE